MLLQITKWDRDSSVGIATRYGLDGLGFESRWGHDSPHLCRLSLGPTYNRPHLAPRLRMSRPIPVLPPCARAWHVTGWPLPLQIKNPFFLGSSWNLKQKDIDGIIDVSSKNYMNCRDTSWKMRGFLMVHLVMYYLSPDRERLMTNNTEIVVLRSELSCWESIPAGRKKFIPHSWSPAYPTAYFS